MTIYPADVAVKRVGEPPLMQVNVVAAGGA
jgi:hypothetical protein